MADNPYHPPRARLDDPPAEREKSWLRLKWYYIVLLIVLVGLVILDMTRTPPVRANPFLVAPLTALGLALGSRFARDIWLMRVKVHSPWVRPARWLALLAGAVMLFYWNESGDPKIYSPDIFLPFSAYLAVATAATWVTERRKGVRVYIGRRSLLFEESQPRL